MTLKFYKRDPSAFIDGVDGMTLEEIGAYTLLLDHMYRDEGALPDRPNTIALILGCDVRVWKRLRTALIRKGKLVDSGDGFITNRRVEMELQVLDLARQQKRKAGVTGGRISAQLRANPLKNKDEAQARAQAPAQAEINQSIKTEDTSSLRSDVCSNSSLRSELEVPRRDEDVVVALRPPLPVSDAVLAYNRVAEANGWARCKEVNATRRAAISARLRKRGLEGWNAALTLAAKADWINDPDKRGRDHKGWKPNIDWFARDRTQLQLFENADETSMADIETPDVWTKRLAYYHEKGKWFERQWGPPPGAEGCRAPSAAS